MISRDGVIDNAERYLNITPWTPSVDVYAFRPGDAAHTFHSAFARADATGKKREYTAVPYVYSGNDSFPQATSTTGFLHRVQNGTCPGGWDRISGQNTSHWNQPAPIGLGYGSTISRHLAGIDCSAYVSRSWGIRRHSTRSLPRLCLPVDRAALRHGDILNLSGSHVRIFEATAGAGHIRVLEATGGARRRQYQGGDEFGSVVRHRLPWTRFAGYQAMSPFPQLIAYEPGPGSYTAPPPMELTVAGSGDPSVISIGVDGAGRAFSQESRASSRGNICRAVVLPGLGLGPGRHTFEVRAGNQVGGQLFVDDFHWQIEVG